MALLRDVKLTFACRCLACCDHSAIAQDIKRVPAPENRCRIDFTEAMNLTAAFSRRDAIICLGIADSQAARFRQRFHRSA